MPPTPPAADKPAKRQWEVRVYPVHPETGETVKLDEYRDDREFAQSILELKGILDRLGGVVSIATKREEFGSGDIRTVALIFRWEAFVPVQRSKEPEPVEEPPTVVEAEDLRDEIGAEVAEAEREAAPA